MAIANFVMSVSDFRYFVLLDWVTLLTLLRTKHEATVHYSALGSAIGFYVWLPSGSLLHPFLNATRPYPYSSVILVIDLPQLLD